MRVPQQPPAALSPGAGPLYRQAKQRLQHMIETGSFAPGSRFPPEPELAQTLGISIGTLRKAVDELVAEHVVVRHQGKGTFVATHTEERFMFQFFHVEPRTDDEPGDNPGRRLPVVTFMGSSRDPAAPAQATALRLRPGEPVITVHNCLSLGGRRIVHDSITLSARLFPGLTERRIRERPSTMYSLYEEGWGITVLNAQEKARALACPPESARILRIPEGSPVMEVRRVARTFGDRPVEYRISTIDTRHHDYVARLGR